MRRLAGAVLLYAAAVSGLAHLAEAPAFVLSLPVAAVTVPLGQIQTYPRFLVYAVVALANALLILAVRRLIPPDRTTTAVSLRLDQALIATGLPVTPMARPARRRERLEKSLLLRDVPVPFPQLVAQTREQWMLLGLHVQDRDPALRAYDREGFEFLVEPGPGVFGDAVLQVASPPRSRRQFWAGLAVGLLPALVLLVPALLLYGRAAGGDDPLLTGTLPLVGTLTLVGPGVVAAGLLLTARWGTRALGRGLVAGGLPGALVAAAWLVYGLTG